MALIDETSKSSGATGKESRRFVFAGAFAAMTVKMVEKIKSFMINGNGNGIVRFYEDLEV